MQLIWNKYSRYLFEDWHNSDEVELVELEGLQDVGIEYFLSVTEEDGESADHEQTGEYFSQFGK